MMIGNPEPYLIDEPNSNYVPPVSFSEQRRLGSRATGPNTGQHHVVGSEGENNSLSVGETHLAVAAVRIQKREQRLFYFLQELMISNEVSQGTATNAWKSWKSIADICLNMLPVPDASAGPDKTLLYTWNKDIHHLELEFFPSGVSEFFYLNFQTDESWGESYQAGSIPPNEAINKLKLFLAHE